MSRQDETGDAVRESATEDRRHNRRVRVSAMAREIMMNGSTWMTQIDDEVPCVRPDGNVRCDVCEYDRIADAVRKAKRRADGWGPVHQHERNGRTVACDKGTNCTARR